MNRKKKLLLNSITALVKQLISIICGFILPRYMLLYFGSSVNGLVSSITHFISFISFLELGIGPVIQANLYEPLANKNKEQISRVIISSERFFRKIAYIFIAYISILLYVFPNYINTDYDFWFTASLLLIIAISSFAEYFFSMTYMLLLNSDQKSYVQISLQIFLQILNTIMSIWLMVNGASIHIVKLFSTLVFVLRPVLLTIYVKTHYEIDKKIILTDEPIKQKWNGFAQHLAFVVSENIDVVVLTTFSSLSNVSVYHVYYLVTTGINSIIMRGATGFEALFGNMIAKNETAILLRTFESIEWLIHFFVTLLFGVTTVTICPFVLVYTKGITDANYYVPVFAVLLVMAYAMQCLRVPYFRVIKAAGHFKQTQNGAFISTILNVIISVAVVIKYGLPGVALGTLVAMLYHTFYFVWYLKSNILNRPIKHFVIYLFVDFVIGFLSYYFCRFFEMSSLSYYSWIVYASKCFLTTLLISLIFNLIVFKDKFNNCLHLLRLKNNYQRVKNE